MSLSSKFFVLGGLAIAVDALLPAGPASSVLYCAIAICALIAVPVGILTSRKTSPHSWWIMTAALACWVTGDVITGISVNTLAGSSTPSAPDSADVAYIAGYLLIAVSLMSSRNPHGRLLSNTDLLEAVIVTSGVGLASWVVVSGPNAYRDVDATVWLGIFYTEFDVLLLTLLMLVVLKRSAGSPTHWLLGGAMALMVVADYLSYVVQSDGRVTTAVLNAALLMSYVLFGGAALRKDELVRVETISRSRKGAARLIMLTAAIAMTPVAISVQLVRGVPVTQWGPVVVVAASIILLLGASRMWTFLMLLQRQSEALRRAADTDVVTGLANRASLSSRLSDLMGPHGRDGVALVLIDLNRFADINQSFGYAVGDQVLAEIGRRLTELVDSDMSVGRLGGDEFAIVLPGPVDRHGAVAVAIAAQRAVAATLTVREIKLVLESSAGVALSSDRPAPCPEELVQHAYAAVITAKTRQPRLAVYDRTMDNDRVDQLRRMGELEDAISAGELEVHYQPRLNLRTGRVSGLEALLRWRHPKEGLLLPGDFLQSAEQTVMMPAVTAYVIDIAIAACSRWRSMGLDVDIAINLSVRDLVDPSLARQVRDTLDRHALPGSAVVFEITETSAMTDPERSIDTLEALRETGVSISIDDFGTGYSSLAYLSALPVQQLKMDRSFVTSIASESANLAIVRSTIELAHSMGLDIVAEGVEDARTVVVLRDLGCDSAQGFHIARPVPASDVVATVRSVDDSSGAAISGV